MSEIEKGEAVAALAEVSLVTRETLDDGSPAISLHRLVQEVMRRRLGEGAAETAALATRLVADAYPFQTDDVRNWPACRRLEAHAAAVLAFAPDTGEAAEKTSHLLNQYAVHLYAARRLRSRPSRFTAARSPSTRQSFGPGHSHGGHSPE